MARRAKKIKELTEILDGHIVDEIDKVDVSILKELSENLSEISDPRNEAYVKHKLSDVIMITFFAVLAGADEWIEIEIFGKKKKEWLQKFLELRNGVPADDTYRLVLSKINANYIYGIIIGFLMKKIEKIECIFI